MKNRGRQKECRMFTFQACCFHSTNEISNAVVERETEAAAVEPLPALRDVGCALRGLTFVLPFLQSISAHPQLQTHTFFFFSHLRFLSPQITHLVYFLESPTTNMSHGHGHGKAAEGPATEYLYKILVVRCTSTACLRILLLSEAGDVAPLAMPTASRLKFIVSAT
jgi:hypothetical protein